MLKKVLFGLIITIFCLVFLSLEAAWGCSLMMKSNKQGIFVGRTTEWWGPLKTRIALIPRGFKDHDRFGSLNWTNKYGVIAIEDDEKFGYSGEGINEQGLNVHLLYQDDSRMPEPQPGLPEISTVAWTKYILATYGSVKEVVTGLKNYRIKMVDFPYQGKKVKVPCHFAVNDASGDAAVIEFNGGKMQVFHGPQYNVMTNEPNYPRQLANLAQFKKEKKQYSVEDLPGGAKPSNRFVRISFNLDNLPQPKDPVEAVAYMEQVIDSVLVPAYDDKKHPFSPQSDSWAARWRVVYDLSRMNMYFDQEETGKSIYLKIKDLDFTGSEIKYLKLSDYKSAYEL